MTKTTDKKEKTETVVNENNCDVDKTKQTLSDLYKNVMMANSCVKTLLPYVEKDSVTKTLHKQVEQYDHFATEIEDLSENLNFDPTPVPRMLVSWANACLKAKVMTDKSVSHIAKIMLQGTLNGLIDLYRLLRENPDVHPDVTLLAKQILRYEEGCFESMKAML